MDIIKDEIIERTDIGICPPIRGVKLLTSKTGFPQPPIVSASSFPNKQHITHKSTDLVLTEKEIAKLEWTNPVSPEEEGTSTSVRYDFEGRVVSEDSAEYKPELYHHGQEPGKAGYTISELFHVSQSGFQSQKALAVKAIGAIVQNVTGRKNKREAHRVFVGEWKAHIRFSVACSDTSAGVQAAAWYSLSQLIACLDTECGCVAADLASIPEFFRAFDAESVHAVQVFLYIVHCFEDATGENAELYENILHIVLEAAEKLELDPALFVCGISNTSDLLNKMVKEESTPAPEAIATLCDRLGCVASEALSDCDIDYFESILRKLSPSIPFFAPGEVDEFQWSTRCNLLIQVITEFAASTKVSLFAGKLCWLFVSSLFPIECRAAVWNNMELLSSISRLVEIEGNGKIDILGNQGLIDFTCADINEITRENSTLVRAIRSACARFLQEEPDACNDMRTAAGKIVDRFGKF